MVERRSGGVDYQPVLGVEIGLGAFLAVLGEGVERGFGGHLAQLGLDHRVVLPEDEGVGGRQVVEDAELGVDIVLHLVVVTVEVVGGDVHDHRHVGLEIVHVLELERAELDDVYVVVLAGHLQRQALADVAGQPYVVARVLEDVVGQQRSGGLAVAACDAHHLGVGVASGQLNL